MYLLLDIFVVLVLIELLSLLYDGIHTMQLPNSEDDFQITPPLDCEPLVIPPRDLDVLESPASVKSN